MSEFTAALEAEPWRHDLFTVLRRLERSFPDKPRIGDSAARREEYVALGEDPYMEFPASNISRAGKDAEGRLQLFVKFLGLLGPQGPLPLATTEEVYGWFVLRDEAFPRFLDIFNNRFLQLYFRAWADARPAAHHDRPDLDRFGAYVGSFLGLGSDIYRGLDSVSDLDKLAYAGLMAPQGKSASRLRQLISGLFGVEVEVDQFVGLHLAFDKSEQTALGAQLCGLGVDAMVGAGVFSLQDKFRVRIFANDLAQYRRFLPQGDLCEPVADAVFFYIGDQLDWDVELAIVARAVEPVRLSRSGQLGWTSWMAPRWPDAETRILYDARFHPGDRLRQKRSEATA